jgi:hypothetical protein
VYGFRIAAIGPLLAGSSAAQEARLDGLGRAALVSGMAVLLVLAVGTLLRRRPDASVLALLAMLLVEVVGVAGGGYYWSHYLIGIVPATSLLVGRAVAVCSRPWLLGLAIAATLTSSVTEVALVAAHPTPVDGTEVGALTAWLDRAQRPGDTAVVLYGEASVFETTGPAAGVPLPVDPAATRPRPAPHPPRPHPRPTARADVRGRALHAGLLGPGPTRSGRARARPALPMGRARRR